MTLTAGKSTEQAPFLGLEQSRMIKSEMARYGVTRVEVAIALGLDTTGVSHTIAGKSKSPRIREMITRMIMAKQLHMNFGSIPETAVAAKRKELFGEE
jgi:hypothetical protein